MMRPRAAWPHVIWPQVTWPQATWLVTWLALSVLSVAPAFAHPDIAVTTRVLLEVKDDKLMALGESWTFDTAYSARLMHDFDTDRDGALSGDEGARLAGATLDDLAGRDYLTRLKAGHAIIDLPAPAWRQAMVQDGAVTLSFVFALAKPLDAKGEKALALQIRDLDYIAAFRLSGDRPVMIRGDGRCAHRIEERTDEAYFGGLIAPWEIVLGCE